MLIPVHPRIWTSFIPFPYLQVFHRGAYFATEVVPGEVAVISLNTMYFYDSNKGQFINQSPFSFVHVLAVVSGCLFKERNDPGNLQLDWLEVQLDMYRKGGLQVRMLCVSLINDADHCRTDIKVWIIGELFFNTGAT